MPTTYLRSFLSVGLLISRKMLESKPSVQSLVVGSKMPYNSITLIAFGFNVNSFVNNPSLQPRGFTIFSRPPYDFSYEKRLVHIEIFLLITSFISTKYSSFLAHVVPGT